MECQRACAPRVRSDEHPILGDTYVPIMQVEVYKMGRHHHEPRRNDYDYDFYDFEFFFV